MSAQKYCKSAGAAAAGGGGGGGGAVPLSAMSVGKHQQQLVRVDTPVTPPPPIPRRQMMRAKCGWQHEVACAADAVGSASNVFVYPQPTNGGGMDHCGATVPHGLLGGQSALLVDIATRPAYADADGISDDDRMSLENSVFDESLTSTPVKVASYHNSRYAATSTTTGTGTGQVASKRAQRSSSSTVDSAYGSSSSGGGIASGLPPAHRRALIFAVASHRWTRNPRWMRSPCPVRLIRRWPRIIPVAWNVLPSTM